MEERLSELRNYLDWELYDSGNTMALTQLEHLAGLVDQVWGFPLFYVNLYQHLVFTLHNNQVASVKPCFQSIYIRQFCVNLNTETLKLLRGNLSLFIDLFWNI